jgi:selenophosphate synthetase-related protein
MKLPVVSILLMSIFLVGGSIMLVVKWPPGPANLDWGVWLLAYFGYIYVIAASLYYVKKGN